MNLQDNVTIESVFELADMPLDEETKQRLRDIQIWPDSARSWMNCARMYSSVHGDRFRSDLETKVFVHPQKGGMLLITLFAHFDSNFQSDQT